VFTSTQSSTSTTSIRAVAQISTKLACLMRWLIIGLSLLERGFMTPEQSGRLRQLATDYKQKIEHKRAREADDAKTLGLVKTEGPNTWAELRQMVKQSVDALNREIGGTAVSWDDLHSDRIVITRTEDAIRLEGGFDLAAYSAFFRCPPAKIDIRLALIVDGGKVKFSPVDSTQQVSGIVPKPEDFAYELVRDFLIVPA